MLTCWKHNGLLNNLISCCNNELSDKGNPRHLVACDEHDKAAVGINFDLRVEITIFFLFAQNQQILQYFIHRARNELQLKHTVITSNRSREEILISQE